MQSNALDRSIDSVPTQSPESKALRQNSVIAYESTDSEAFINGILETTVVAGCDWLNLVATGCDSLILVTCSSSPHSLAMGWGLARGPVNIRL